MLFYKLPGSLNSWGQPSMSWSVHLNIFSGFPLCTCALTYYTWSINTCQFSAIVRKRYKTQLHAYAFPQMCISLPGINYYTVTSKVIQIELDTLTNSFQKDYLFSLPLIMHQSTRFCRFPLTRYLVDLFYYAIFVS